MSNYCLGRDPPTPDPPTRGTGDSVPADPTETAGTLGDLPTSDVMTHVLLIRYR